MLLAKDRDELHGSALTDETIAEAKLYTETDPKKIQLILGWKTPASCLGPFLILPFMNSKGEWDGFARVKPTFPRTSRKKNGDLKKVKYEQPAGAGLRLFIPPGARSAVNTDGVMLAISEGEKKALCATQTGVPTVALCGVEAWGKRGKDDKGHKTGPRSLIEDLACINWLNRVVLIIFDTDSDHNPDVARAAAELARVLTELGATVHIVELPLGPVGPDGLPQKMGLDDYLVLRGRDALHELIEHYLSPPRLRDVQSYREDLVAARLKVIGRPGVYLDTSPTGSGKSRADIAMLSRVNTSRWRYSPKRSPTSR